MPSHPASLISLDIISPEQHANPNTRNWQPEHEQEVQDSSASLCNRCQNFDFQSFARSTTSRKGYLLSDVESSAAEGCEFCSLLFESVKDVAVPEYMESNTFWGKKRSTPDIYVHMTLSKDYAERNSMGVGDGLQANRMLLEIGDRFSGVRNRSNVEICLAADPSELPCTFMPSSQCNV
jgi:hypothetical protein